MPEMHFEIEWPDRSRSLCYSPSLVISEHFEAGRDYPLSEFLVRSRNALTEASERVRARYGFACSRALGQLEAIEDRATDFTDEPEAKVAVIAFHRAPA